MNLRCTSCAKYCCDDKKCSCSCHKKSFNRSNQYLSNVMDGLLKQNITPTKHLTFTRLSHEQPHIQLHGETAGENTNKQSIT